MRRLLWHVGNSKLPYGLMLACVLTVGVLVGKTIDRAGGYAWGVGWSPEQHRGTSFLQVGTVAPLAARVG